MYDIYIYDMRSIRAWTRGRYRDMTVLRSKLDGVYAYEQSWSLLEEQTDLGLRI